MLVGLLLAWPETCSRVPFRCESNTKVTSYPDPRKSYSHFRHWHVNFRFFLFGVIERRECLALSLTSFLLTQKSKNMFCKNIEVEICNILIYLRLRFWKELNYMRQLYRIKFLSLQGKTMRKATKTELAVCSTTGGSMLLTFRQEDICASYQVLLMDAVWL